MATFDLSADEVTDGELAVSAPGGAQTLSADHYIDGVLAVAIPPLEGRKRVVVCDTFGNTIADLENAVVGDVAYPLNSPERWGFTLPVDDPKAHVVLDERMREAQVWRGDQLLSWGPMKRPAVSDTELTVQGEGARWHLGRRHVGKASRDNQLTNGNFENGLSGWHFLKEWYFLSYRAMNDGDARIFGPAMDRGRALELNGDMSPWVTPFAALAGDTYVVVGGDTLWSIAKDWYGSGTEWWRIYEGNQALIQADAEAAGDWNPRDPDRHIYAGQVLDLPPVPVDQARYAPADDSNRWGSVFAFQDIEVTTGERELVATLSAWIKIRGDLLEAWNPHRWGVQLGLFEPDYRTNNYWSPTPGANTWGGYRGLYTEVIEYAGSQLDRGHPRGRWIRHECSITVPADSNLIIHARLWGVQGRCYWDNAALTFDTAFEQHDVDQATIVAELAEHAQDPAFDKNDVNITHDCPLTGVERTLVALHSEHGNIEQLMGEYTRLRDGLDIGMRYTPTERILTTHYPRKGVERRGLHLQPGRNIASFLWTFDGEAAASSVVMLGTGDGSDREEASAIDDSAFADGLILETVVAVGPDTPPNLLPELADEHLAVVRDPEVLTVTTFPHDVTVPHRNLIGRLWEGDTVPVTIRKGRIIDPITEAVVAHQFEVDKDYRVVELVILTNDALRLTLNRRATA